MLEPERRAALLPAFLSAQAVPAAEQISAELCVMAEAPEIKADIAAARMWRWILEHETIIFKSDWRVAPSDAKNILWLWFFVGFIEFLTLNSYSSCSKQQPAERFTLP
jgi:hypothetical protein